MTTSNDIDRRIAAFFDEGPARVSESTIDGVLAHARAHPRRRDPLRALRRDPMGSGGGFGALLRPLPLLAALALLVVAAVAGAAVGGWFDRDPSVVPPIVSPSPSQPTPPSDAPSIGPNPETTPPAEGGFRVDLIEHVGQDAYVDVFDASGTLEDAVSGDPGDGMSVADGEVQVEADVADPNTIVLTWSGGPCDTKHRLDIGADGRDLAITRPACTGDSIGVDHVLRLTFDGPVPIDEVRATIETTT
jgi:hypothetical protein